MLFTALIACQSTKYHEQEIQIVLPTPPSAQIAKPGPQVVAAVSKNPETITHAAVAERWKGIQRLLSERRMTLDDLSLLSPSASKIPEEVITDSPNLVALKLATLKKAIENTAINREFLDRKLARTKTLLAQKTLPPGKQGEMNDRMGAIPRLLEGENFAVANETLTSIQEDLAEMSTSHPEEIVPTEAPVPDETPSPTPKATTAAETASPRSPS